MVENFHDPYRQSDLLLQSLAPDKMRIAFLLGAGCPVSIRVESHGESGPLIPDIRGLTEAVGRKLSASEDFRDRYLEILNRVPGESPNIENILTHIRALGEIIQEGDFKAFSKQDLIELDNEICQIITNLVDVALPNDSTPYHQLANWIGGVQRKHPIEVFTPDYDLLIEQALEAYKIPYFDGFVGSRNAFFDLTSMDMENEDLPARWARLWKIHGSVNWWRTKSGDVVRRVGKSDAGDDRQMIYPSHLKYDQSRRMPYLAMLDRLRSFLSRGQGVLVTCGYSFADEHLNEIILDGLRSNPTAICFGLLYSGQNDYVDAFKAAEKQPNLNLLAADAAVLGTRKSDWQQTLSEHNPMHGISVVSESKTNSDGDSIDVPKFNLGDFKAFGKFLEWQLSQVKTNPSESSHA